MIRRTFAASLLLLPLFAFAQETPKPKPTPSPEGAPFEAKFADSSAVNIFVQDTVLTVKTKYGKLEVPLDEVKKIELGFRYPEGVEAKIAALADALGSADFKEREAAQKQLTAYGELALPAARKAMKSSSVEAARRAEEIVKKLEDTLPKEKLEIRDYDVLTTATMTIKGTIENTGIKAKTKYFGDSVVKLADLRELRPIGSSASDNVTLDSAKYAKQAWTTWHDTNLDVSTDSGLEITATGKIDQWIQSPGQYMTGPNGNNAIVQGPPNNLQPNVQYKSGAIYGKIGEKGTPFLIGENYKQAKAPGTGRLYLIIAPSNWGNDSVGEYKISIKSGG